MTEEQKAYSEHYRRVREAFDELEIESQARFLVEATAATIGRGIDLLANIVAEDLDEAFKAQEQAHAEKPGEEGAPPPPNGNDDDDDPSPSST